MSLTLPKLIDIANLQMLMDRFYAATGIPVGIIGSDGEILVATGWQEVCTAFHRRHPVTAERCRQSDDYIKSHLTADSYVQYKCRNGLWDLARPIVIAGEHVAILFLRQFLYDDEEIDEGFFRSQALEFGFVPDSYLAALRRVPVYTREKVREIMDFYISFVDVLVGAGFANYRQMETERVLRESEERHRALFEGANEAIFTIRDGLIVNCNRKALEIFRCSAEKFIGRRPEHLSPPVQPDGIDSAAKARERLTQTLTGPPQFFEWRHLRGDGAPFDAEVSLSRLEYGGKTEVLAIIRDITERKQAEEALKVSEAEKSLILDSTMDLVVYHDTDMKILWGNRKALDSVGMRPEDMAGGRCWEIWHERTKACTGCPVVLAMDSGEPQETEIGSPDGREWYIRGFPVKDDDGRIKGVVEFCLDITERKRAEKALRESEEKFARAFRSTPSVLVISTLAEGRYIEVNETFERLLGYSREEAIGRTSLELNIWETPEARAWFLDVLRQEGKVRDLEAHFRSKEGDALVGLLSAEVIEIKGEECLLVLVNDITARKRMEEEIESLNTHLASHAMELEAANRELEAFNYTVSHDLCSPLTGISGYCELMLELGGERLGEQYLGYVQQIRDAAGQMKQLTSTLLGFSRLARCEIKREEIDLTAIAKGVAAQFRMAEPCRRVSFTFAEGAKATGDGKLLWVVMENLLGNAWKFTGKQETALIEFDVAVAGGRPIYFVRDNGPGFDAADADILFRPFHRLSGTTDFTGYGIGLATVQRIIQRHGGRVWAEGEPGKGATFYFTL